ncbi:23S rRNA (uracil(1939)-C(5))-methyltransferase RlmD [Prochlorococcus sp. MIT 1341]|uniref:23S rRNA (uracil(1939)-C(5))-methyltransferase RlmD n=1 Tax=Prochlorococcus sp. MIT 1341 TaxID=3096221 RepID=UPI002A75262C|nr:23S rRNA (uracil(1939)-C(5))-methyltransferase RlmD [Prochlorococcus sp. MIT 1341]
MFQELEAKQIEVECVDLDRHGLGIARSGKTVVSVPGLIPGEIAVVRLLRKKGSIWLSELLDIRSLSKNREAPICSVFPQCGGCTIQHLKYDQQLQSKNKHVLDSIVRISNIKDFKLNPINSCGNSFGYRNRTLIPLNKEKGGEINIGYYQRGTHSIVNMTSCPVHNEHINYLIKLIRPDLDNISWQMNSDKVKFSGLRFLGIRTSNRTNQTLLTLVSNTTNLPGLEQLATKWLKSDSHIVGVTLNIKDNYSNSILGYDTILVCGKPYIEEYFCGLRLLISSTSFFQLNTSIAEQAVTKIVDWISSKNVDSVLDCYCGIGTISLPLAFKGLNVLGIEVNSDSINLARLNARANNLNNADFLVEDVDNHISEYINNFNAVVLDPPRKGLSSNIIQTIINSRPSYIAYMSCNVSTHARDLKAFCEDNLYVIESVNPYDFFPQTSHVEVITFLTLSTSLTAKFSV